MRKLTYPITPAKLHLVQKMFPSLGLNLSVRRPFRSINIRGIWIQICAKLTEFESWSSAPGISVKVFGKSRVDITSVSPKMEANPMLSIYHNWTTAGDRERYPKLISGQVPLDVVVVRKEKKLLCGLVKNLRSQDSGNGYDGIQFQPSHKNVCEGSAESGFCKEKKITNTQAIRKAYIDITVEIKGEICGLWLREMNEIEKKNSERGSEPSTTEPRTWIVDGAIPGRRVSRTQAAKNCWPVADSTTPPVLRQRPNHQRTRGRIGCIGKDPVVYVPDALLGLHVATSNASRAAFNARAVADAQPEIRAEVNTLLHGDDVHDARLGLRLGDAQVHIDVTPLTVNPRAAWLQINPRCTPLLDGRRSRAWWNGSDPEDTDSM
ncbi:hypothetical protein C8J57DRAFT_1615303 [Mycena rebaudengoi]|nr:hypothetical protein C8J57DRAFT_1615303 [Mycena rebaudengoi]